MEILPAIIPSSYEEIEYKVNQLDERAKTVQLDLMDGTYVNRKTWPFKETSGVKFTQILSEEVGMPSWEKVNYELDLMMKDPVLDDIYKIGPSRIVLHLGGLTDPASYMDTIDQYFKDTIEFGIAVRPHEDVTSIFGLIDTKQIKFVQCMGIDKVGYQGNPFDNGSLSQVKILREKYPDLHIAVDGSVNRDTAEELVNAGATRLVVGSAIFDAGDPLEELAYFKSL